jgi:dTDP-4-amino-4,6-dideoxygalactose transaminase
VVPLLDLTVQNLALEQELKSAFERILRSGHYILGPDVSEFEMEVASLVGVKHAIGVSSGTDAILVALMALDIAPGDEVLCPAFTFFATAGCVARLGAKPVFVDADPVTFNLEVADASRKVTSRTKAILPVHLFGQCADMDGIGKLADAHGLAIIEDAAQSFGAKYRGRFAGSMGSFGTYSFFPSKNLGGLGDGGMLVCNDDALAEKARLLRNHGAQPKYYHRYIGGNFRLDTLQAALLRVKLPWLQTYNQRRQENATYYTERLGLFQGVEQLVLPRAADGEHIWNQYTIRVPAPGRRDALRAHLQKRGIASEIYYPIPLDRQECFRGLDPSFCDNAAVLSEQVLSLPIFPELASVERDQVVAAIAEFYQGNHEP